MSSLLELSEALRPKTGRLRHKLLLNLRQRLRDGAGAELEPTPPSALARFGVHFGIPAKRIERLSADLLVLEPLLRQTLEAEALAYRRAVAWDRAQAAQLPKGLQPWVVLELETLQCMKFSELRPRDWRAEYEPLPLRERDRLRKKGQRQASPYFRRGAPVLRAHPIIEARAQLIAAAIADGARATEFRTRTDGTPGQLRYLKRRLPLSRRSGSPALDLLLASLRYALPINTTLGGLPERSVARVAETLTQPEYFGPPVRAYAWPWDDEIVLKAPQQTSDSLWARVFRAGSDVKVSAEPQEGPADDFDSSQSKNPRQPRKRR